MLIAEDGPDNQRLLAFHLRKAGAAPEVADNGRVAIEMILADELAVIFNDGYPGSVGLPPLGLCVYVVDAYLQPPPHERQKLLNQLLAKMTALSAVDVNGLHPGRTAVGLNSRRHSFRPSLQRPSSMPAPIPASAANAVTSDIFRIDSVRRQIHYHDRPLDLTLHEYRLLETLLSQPERVFTRGQLLERGWDDPDHRLERTIDSHIKSLRNKLRRIKPDADPICTHRGVGYSLIPGA